MERRNSFIVAPRVCMGILQTRRETKAAPITPEDYYQETKYGGELIVQNK